MEINEKTFKEWREKAQKEREQEILNSEQLALGEIISKCEEIQKNYTNKELFMYFDFCDFVPDKLISWRGNYYELAIGYKESECGGRRKTLPEFIKQLKDAVGAKFDGYKEGEFKMNKNTPVWVANSGERGGTAIVDVVKLEEYYAVLLITKYMIGY